SEQQSSSPPRRHPATLFPGQTPRSSKPPRPPSRQPFLVPSRSELLDRMRQPHLHDPAPLTHSEQRLVESGRPADHPPIPKPEPRLMPRAGDHTPRRLPPLQPTPRASPPRPHPVRPPPPPPAQPPPPARRHRPHPPPRRP